MRQAQSLNLPSNIYYMAPGKPIVIITWLGQKPELSSVLLNSHMDVVPVYPVKNLFITDFFNLKNKAKINMC